MRAPFRILWIDDEAHVGGTRSGTGWPAIIMELVDTTLAELSGPEDGFKIMSIDPNKRASYCEVVHAGTFIDGIEIIRNHLGNKGADSAILDVRLTATSGVEMDEGIQDYLEQQGCPPEVYFAVSEGGRKPARKDMWLVFWLYREIVTKYPTTPVFLYTNYTQLAEDVGLRPFMNPQGRLSPAIYDKADNVFLGERIKFLIEERRKNKLSRISPLELSTWYRDIGEAKDCQEMLGVLTGQEAFAKKQAITLADLFPEIALRAQQNNTDEFGEDRVIILRAIENALPQYNRCALYLRYCRPSVFDWTGKPLFGIKTLEELGCKNLIEVDRPRSPFELLTHSSADPQSEAARIAWQNSPEWARQQMNILGNAITEESKSALMKIIEIRETQEFPADPPDNKVNDLRKSVQWTYASLKDSLSKLGLTWNKVKENESSVGTFFGCQSSIEEGVRRLAEDLVENRKPSQSYFAFGHYDARPIWIALWGEYDDDRWGELNSDPRFHFPEFPMDGNKIPEAEELLNGFFHLYQFLLISSNPQWIEQRREEWAPCGPPDVGNELLERFGLAKIMGHLLVVEDYPPRK